jgi:hypothetical protein
MAETNAKRIVRIADESKAFIQLECGTWLFLPGRAQGAWTDRALIAVANELKRRNAIVERFLPGVE